MEAIILAGGFGTRLASVVSDVPKPMAPINGKPFLEYLIRYLKKNGVDRVVLSVGYKWETIKTYFGETFFGVELVYSVESSPLGTGGAIRKALNEIQQEDFFVINGDSFFDINLETMVEYFRSTGGVLMMALKEMESFDRYGCVESNDGRVSKFTEKGFYEKGNINCGIYLAKRTIFDPYELGKTFSFEDFLQNHTDDLDIRSIVFDGYFIDIGIPEDYMRAEKDLHIL